MIDEFDIINDSDINFNKGKTKEQIKEATTNKKINFIFILLINTEILLNRISQIIQFINDFD